MTALRQRFIDDLRIRNYADRTISTYVTHVARFARHFGRSPDLLGPEHFRLYQIHLLGQRASWSRFNQAVAALRFFFVTTLGRAEALPALPYGKKPRSLPAVLSAQEVVRLFAAVQSQPRDLMLLQTAYAAGLRVSELVRLKVCDIDSQRLLLHVRAGRRARGRNAPAPTREWAPSKQGKAGGRRKGMRHRGPPPGAAATGQRGETR